MTLGANRVELPPPDEVFGSLSSIHLTVRQPLQALLEAAGFNKLLSSSPAEDLRDALEQLKSLIVAAHLDDIDRATAIKLVLDQLAGLKIKNVRPLVKATLGEVKPPAGAGNEAANSITLVSDKPADEPIPGSTLLHDTAELFRRHVILRSSSQADAIALWVAAAYVIDALSLMPILLITSPTMRSGKTTLMTLLGAILPRALTVSSLTGAGLARAIAAFSPTVLADEADTWLTDQSSELRGIMNAGHTRATAFVLRCSPDTHEPKLIPCFGARVLSMIRQPPATIADRAISIEIRRKRTDEMVHRFRVDRLREDKSPLRRRWQRWANDHVDEIGRLDPEVPAGLHDRAADNWRPLLAISELVGGDWPVRAHVAAVELSATGETDESLGIELLRDVRVVFAARATPTIPSAELTADLVAMPERPWAESSQGRPMSSIKLARQLRPFGIHTRKVREGAKTFNSYLCTDFEDIWARYLPLDSEQLEQANDCDVPCKTVESGKALVPRQEAGTAPTQSRLVPTVPPTGSDSDAERETSVDHDCAEF